MVGVAGFEPTTPCYQGRCDNLTTKQPEKKTTKHYFLLLQKYKKK